MSIIGCVIQHTAYITVFTGSLCKIAVYVALRSARPRQDLLLDSHIYAQYLLLTRIRYVTFQRKEMLFLRER